MRETSMKTTILQSVRVTLVLTFLLGFAYPALVWGVGQVAFREKANGSLLRMKESGSGGAAHELQAAPAAGAAATADAPSDRIVGSALLGQSFHSKNLFHGRPSAAGEAGYDPTASGGTNLGPTSKKLADAVAAEIARARAENPAAGNSPVPADLVTSSASGLDPHLSPDAARWQVPRVSKATGIAERDLFALVEKRTEGRFLGVFGEPRVNVLLLNRDLLARGVVP